MTKEQREFLDTFKLVELLEYYHYFRFNKQFQVSDKIREGLGEKGFQLQSGESYLHVAYKGDTTIFDTKGMYLDYRQSFGNGVAGKLLTSWKEIA